MKQFDTNNILFDKLPKDNSVYRHFKGTFYKVIGCGIESETKNIDVVYYGLIPEKSSNFWIRDAEMFLSTVDKEKYPNVDQEERFKCVDLHIDYARHAIGMDYNGHRRTYKGKVFFTAWRNHYDAEGNDIEVMEDLVRWGFAEKNSYGMYRLTDTGMLWITKVCDDVDIIKTDR